MAEQQADAYKKKQEELRVQYEKEQDLHNNKWVCGYVDFSFFDFDNSWSLETSEKLFGLRIEFCQT